MTYICKMMPYLTFQKHDICDRRAEKCHIPESDQSVHVQVTEQVRLLMLLLKIPAKVSIELTYQYAYCRC